ncbi:hypothetical protein NE235_10845 [Actinoallomurus spadix]|uniref:Uncharacterized protein n=1 Tax=Actinoallomurus spadix TaxID=79912 RepID=A0ABN0WW55_9ACTN|nr:hypothetical protein [Actinoallomurus spadix]MCO5986600.1 hypothetical protein [Actinoallomurus spadix]
MSTSQLIHQAGAHPRYALAAAAVALVLVLAVVRKLTRGRRAEDVLTVIAAVIATTVAGTGMWRFFSVTLHFSGLLRALLFAFIEVSVFTSALRARRNVAESATHTAGVDGAAVWALTGLSAVLSALDARSFAEVLFRLVAPLVAAWLWERSMAVERRRITGRSIHWRVTPERLFVWLGLAEPADRTAADVDVHRRLHRVARAAKRLRVLRARGERAWRIGWAERRLDRVMAAAVEYAGLASDPDRQEELVDQLGVLYHAAALADLSPAAPWAVPAAPASSPLYRVPPSHPALGWPLDDDLLPGTPESLVRWLDEDGRVPDDEVRVPEADECQVRAAGVFAEEVLAGRVPSIRAIKKQLRIGTDRAREVQAYLADLAERGVPAGVAGR